MIKKIFFEMENWNRIPSLVKQLFVEFIVLITLSTSLSALWISKENYGCPLFTHPKISSTTYGALIIGIVGLFWMLWRIFFPRSLKEEWQPALKMGKIAIPNPACGSVRYSFLSSHPSYIFFDFFIVAVALFFRFIVGTYPPTYGCVNYLFPYVLGWVMFFTSFIIPISRIFAWYILKRRPSGHSSSVAWKPVLILCLFLWPVIFGIPAAVFIEPLFSPLINENNFMGNLSHPIEWKNQTVRVEGILKDVVRCHFSKEDPSSFRIASALLDLGRAGEVIAYGTSDNASWLAWQKDKNLGKKIQVYGTLQELPTPLEFPDFKSNFLDCGWEEYSAPSQSGRAFLKM